MNGKGIIDDLECVLGNISGLNQDFAMGLSHTKLLEIHSRVMAAHCECLGMNAENMWAAIADKDPVYTKAEYDKMMEKWGLVDKEGKPTI